MSTQTPTTAELTSNILGAIEAQIGQSVPLLPKAFLRVLAKVLAATFITLYKYVGFTGLQMFVRTASASPTVINGQTVTPLIEYGRLIDIGDPTPATATELSVTVTVNNQTGTLPSGSQLLGADNGVVYLTVGAVLLNAATVTVTVRAADRLGVVGNLPPGAVLNFANPLANVNRVATVLAQTVTGADAEDLEVYRQRVIDRFKRRPQGGAYADYAIWSEAVAGIVNAYPYTGQPGEVDVYVESSTGADGIPTQAQLDAVFAAIELPDRRPANAYVNVLPITRSSFGVTVSGLTGDDLATLQADVTAAIQSYFLRVEPYIVGLDTPPRTDRITSIDLLGIVNDITRATGGSFDGVTFGPSGTSTVLTVYSVGAGEKAKALSVVYV
jgi:uncharacterized phage protein gp47/JayE